MNDVSDEQLSGTPGDTPGSAPSSSDNHNDLDWYGYTYVVQSIPFPTDMGAILHAQYYDDVVYFDVLDADYNLLGIYSMSIDGTNITQLTDYEPPVIVPDNAIGNVNINAIIIDSNGSLWVLEQWIFYTPDFPEHLNVTEMDNEELWEYYSVTDFGSCLRKLDDFGAEVISIDISNLTPADPNLHVSDFVIDDFGNLYLAIRHGSGATEIFLLDSGGNALFTLNYKGDFESFVRMPDSSIAISPVPYQILETPIHELQLININAKSFGDTIEIPHTFARIYGSSRVVDFIVDDGISVYGYNIGDEESLKILTWLEYDVIPTNIVQIEITENGDIICISTGWNIDKQRFDTELLVFERVSEIAERTVITLATHSYSGEYDETIALFNRASVNYRVEIVDYSRYDTVDNSNGGIIRLTAEISSGNVPDILDISALAVSDCMKYAESGVFADIYNFIDEDTEFHRSDFLETVFQAAEINGSLYVALHTFSILGLFGHPSVVGTDIGWTLEDFTDVIKAYPEANVPIGHWLTKDTMLQRVLMLELDNYIDWEYGNTYFNTPSFTQLLELVNSLPVMTDLTDFNSERLSFDPVADIRDGHQIIIPTEISSFLGIWFAKMWFNGEVMLKTYPSESSIGSILSIPSGLAIFENSQNKEGAWAFVSTFLSKDWQRNNIQNGFPTNKSAFELYVSEALEADYGNELVFYNDEGMILDTPDIEPLMQYDVDLFVALIDSVAVIDVWGYDEEIWRIISEEASDYFNGICNAEDAARVIQSRVSILVSERS